MKEVGRLVGEEIAVKNPKAQMVLQNGQCNLTLRRVIIMTTEEERLTRLTNLLSRMEYNETQCNWKLTGPITRDEFRDLQEALSVYRGYVQKMYES